MKVSIIIPVYNEAATVEKIVEKVWNLPIEKELIIVDDGSTDGSREIIKSIEDKYKDKKDMKFIYHQENKGKGEAIKNALKLIEGDIVVIQDADMELDPAEIPSLIEPIKQGKARVVYGARYIKPEQRKRPFLRNLANYILSLTVTLLYRHKITDEAAGYKVFLASVIKDIPLNCRGFEFCPEITAKVLKRGEKILEVPVSYDPRTAEEGKKICWKDGFKALWTLFKYRFVG
ncbi:MAG: glycosyltransferase family 2 protein [Caldiserica bacterium]|nr:glycosyltransferase family 2 protein [Caldisericota bacterium]